METQYINLNMTPTGVNPCFHISQYDVGRMLGFIVYSGGVTVDLDTYTCTIEATRSDGTAITSAVATTDNIGTFEVTPTMSNKADKYKCQLVIVDENSKRIASLPFDMEVTKAAMDENAESIEEDASLYQQYTEAVQGAIAEANADIQAEENARIAAISAEATTRANADATLQNNIDAEATTRAETDNNIVASLEEETYTRINENSELNERINALRELFGSPLVASTVSAMSDTTKVYVYTGSESGYTTGHWYYWNGTAWTDGGVYQSSGINTDKTLSVSGTAADAFITGTRIDDNAESLDVISDLVSLGYARRLPVSQATNGYWMDESGAGAAQSEYVFERYVVNAGDTIYVRTVKILLHADGDSQQGRGLRQARLLEPFTIVELLDCIKCQAERQGYFLPDFRQILYPDSM